MLEINNPNKWKDGDTFALKIENCDYPSFNGKYLILNFIKRDYHANIRKPFFRIKIVDSIEHIDIEKLDSSDYVITSVVNVMNSSGILDDILKDNEELADHYGYLYQYQIKILTNKKYTVPSELVYIGNYKLKEPNGEYIPWTPHNIPLELWSDVVNESICFYELFNLKKSPLFDEKKAKEWYNQLNDIKKAAIKCVKKIREEDM
jgi:hypothetical protein